MRIYENIVIGNFLYSLGIAMGRRLDTEDIPLSINLLQQTPLDRGAGDVLIQGARMMRLLEFKRAENDDDKEESKLLHLYRSLRMEENADLIPLSRQVHWFLELQEPQNFKMRIVPYLDFLTTHSSGPAFQDFVDGVARDAVHADAGMVDQYARYLKIVAESQGSIKGSSGGLIVSVDQNNQLHYLVVEDLRDLTMELTLFHDMQFQREKEQIRELELEWSRQHPDPEIEGWSI